MAFENKSPSWMAKQIDLEISHNLRKANVRSLSQKERTVVAELQQNLVDIRVYTTEYELSETREAQLKNAKIARRWLKLADKNILAASQYNIFNAIDVAHLSAQIEQTIAYLE